MKKLILLAIFPLLLSNLSAQNETDVNEENAKYHEFDFWLGEWDVFRTGTKDILGYSTIESIIISCNIVSENITFWIVTVVYQSSKNYVV